MSSETEFQMQCRERKCLRCGYVWHPRYPLLVRYCARCKSKLWNQPRKYLIQIGTEAIKQPTQRRKAKTGRAAAKANELNRAAQEFESEVLRRCVNCNATNLNAEIVYIENLSINLCRKCKSEFQM